MKVLVLGGTGFIGRHVATRLAEDGHDVTVFHRGGHEPDLPLGVRHVRDPYAAIPIVHFPALLADPTPDVVIHMVPMGERDARAAVRTFRNAGRLVAVSSGDVYRAYGRLVGREPEADDEAADEPPLLDENAPLPIPPGAPDLAYDTSRLCDRLGFEEPIDSEEGVRLTANWLRAME